MKKKNRRNFTADFKAREALEAARGVKTINEIAAEHDLHPVQVGQWKRCVGWKTCRWHRNRSEARASWKADIAPTRFLAR
jgi:transposase